MRCFLLLFSIQITKTYILHLLFMFVLLFSRNNTEVYTLILELFWVEFCPKYQMPSVCAENSFFIRKHIIKSRKKIYMIYREQTIYSCSWVVLLQCKMQEPFSILLPPDPKRARTEMAIHSNHPCQFPPKLLRDSCTYCSTIKGNFSKFQKYVL